jgi:hypothetical protein
MIGNCMGMSNTYRFTATSYDGYPASEWASPRFVMVSLKMEREDYSIITVSAATGSAYQ